MPIRLTCTACSKTIQAPDTAAGKRVKCPLCQAVVAVPAAEGTAPAPRPLPPPPAPAAAPRPLPATPAAAAAPAPLPAAPAPLPGSPFEFDEGPAKPARKAKRTDSDEKPKRKREDDEEEDWGDEKPRAGAKGWGSFGSGCGMVKLGIWIEFGAILYMVLLAMVAFASIGKGRPPFADVGSFVLVPFPIGMLVGTIFVLFGRVKMMTVPRNTGAAGVLAGAFVLTLIRLIAVLAGTLFIILGAVNDGPRGGPAAVEYLGRGFLAMVVASFPGGVAELTMVTAMAIAGGCIPSQKLRQRAGLVMMVIQIFSILYLILLFAAYSFGEDATRPRGGMGRGGGGGGGNSDPTAILYVILLVYTALQFAYTFLHSTMYSAAQEATRAPKRAPDADDE